MINLLKTFGKGVLYILGLPFFIVVLLAFAVVGLLIFLYQIIKSVIVFFTGHKFFPELPEDKELRLLKEKPNSSYEEPNKTYENPNVYEDISDELINEEPQKKEVQEEAFVDPTFNNVEEACFGKDEPVQEIEEAAIEENMEENISDDEDDLVSLLEDDLAIKESKKEDEDTFILTRDEEDVLETNQEENKIVSDENEEILETYTPKSSDYIEGIDDDENDNGVDINFDDL